jgi:bifunctional NMN adenylyltransferase/nudix hydrolase
MNEQTNAEVGVIIGRFQSPYLTAGHIDIITRVMALHPRVMIFVGQHFLKGTKKDPLPFIMRRAMLEDRFRDIEVHRIDDVGDITIWSRDLDRQIALLINPNHKVVLYGSRKSFVDKYKGHYPTVKLEAVHDISASEVRRLVSIKPKNTQDFREGMVYQAYNQWDKVYPTVDIAIWHQDKLLLGRKPKDTLWRFPGGFAAVTDMSYEETAVREMKEETHLIATEEPTYIASRFIDDVRYKDQTDKIKTILFVSTNWEGNAKAGDDLCEVKWFDIAGIDRNIILPNHQVLFELFWKWIEKQHRKISIDKETKI